MTAPVGDLDVATAYGVGPETLRNWLVKYREANGGTDADTRAAGGGCLLEKASAYFAREQR